MIIPLAIASEVYLLFNKSDLSAVAISLSIVVVVPCTSKLPGTVRVSVLLGTIGRPFVASKPMTLCTSSLFQNNPQLQSYYQTSLALLTFSGGLLACAAMTFCKFTVTCGPDAVWVR